MKVQDFPRVQKPDRNQSLLVPLLLGGYVRHSGIPPAQNTHKIGLPIRVAFHVVEQQSEIIRIRGRRSRVPGAVQSRFTSQGRNHQPGIIGQGRVSAGQMGRLGLEEGVLGKGFPRFGRNLLHPAVGQAQEAYRVPRPLGPKFPGFSLVMGG